MAKKGTARHTQQVRVSDEKRERERLISKADMEQRAKIYYDQFARPDDVRMAAYRTNGLATELGIARRGKGTQEDWLAAHCDHEQAGWRMITYPTIRIRPAALPHLKGALDNEERFAAAIMRLHQQAPTLCMIFLLVCLDSPWSEGDVARAFNDGGARSGWTRENVTKRKAKACLWLRAWTDPRPLPPRKEGEYPYKTAAPVEGELHEEEEVRAS